MLVKKKAVIFGGSGYIGAAVAKYMKDKFDVVVADIKSPRQPGQSEFIRCDVRDYAQVEHALEGASVAAYFSVVQIPQINTEKRLGYEVNILGLQNVCEAAIRSPTLKCVIQSGTWHVFGERGLSGTIDESFGFRPDNVEERARYYALCKMVQEGIMRLYDEMGRQLGKTYGVIRMGTVLGENMPEQTAASLFITNSLSGAPLTPYKNSMYRPMLYVDLLDVCRGYVNFALRALKADANASEERLPRIVNLVWPEPLTILELAELVRETVREKTMGRIVPSVVVKDTGLPDVFSPGDKVKFKVDSRIARELLGGAGMTDPHESIRRLVERSIAARTSSD